jgi:hypothetical protein
MALSVIEVAPSELKKAIESQHGGTATFVQSVPIHEEHNGETVWNGAVAVFDLAGHPTAKRAYAWSYELAGGRRRFFAVLHAPPINGPREAVRAAIVAEQKRINACPRCVGTGVVVEGDYKHLQPKPQPDECPDCNGTGSRSRIATK